MKQILFILIFIGTLLFVPSYGQDTVAYRQANAALFSNTYTFFKENKSDKNGTFRQKTSTDDGQCWVGQGVFIEKGRKIILTFDSTKFNPRVDYKLNENHREILIIKWFELWGNPQEFFDIKYSDSTTNKDIYESSWQKGFVEIPLKELKDRKLTLYNFNCTRKIADFQVPDETNEIYIFANDSKKTQIHNKSRERLKKRKNGFKSVGMWTKGKKTLFVKIVE